jgi:phosphinothricin acetyltransferase
MIEIRKAHISDASSIAEILNQAISEGNQTAFMEPVPVSDREKWLLNHQKTGYPVYVAIEPEEKQIMGYLSLSPWRSGRDALKNTAEVSYYVHEQYRRRGVAVALMNHAIRECRAIGIDGLLAILLDINAPSISLLEKFGFERWGHLPGVANLKEVRAGQYIYGRILTGH